MIWELHNPSDSYTFRAESEELAFMVTAMLGEGWYAATSASGDQIPLLAFGGQDVHSQKFGAADFGALCQRWFTDCERRQQLAGALDSLLIGKAGDRASVEFAVSKLNAEDAQTFLAKRHDDLRSSMNDIGRFAQHWVSRLRSKEAS